MVSLVQVLSSWPVLRTGLCFYDLPGSGDVHAGRTSVVERFMQEGNAFLVFTDYGRAGTDKDCHHWLRRLTLEYKAGTTKVVATRVDGCDKSEVALNNPAETVHRDTAPGSHFSAPGRSMASGRR